MTKIKGNNMYHKKLGRKLLKDNRRMKVGTLKLFRNCQIKSRIYLGETKDVLFLILLEKFRTKEKSGRVLKN